MHCKTRVKANLSTRKEPVNLMFVDVDVKSREPGGGLGSRRILRGLGTNEFCHKAIVSSA